MKKLLSYILTFILLFSIIPTEMVSFAADKYVEGNYEYEVKDNRAIIVNLVNNIDGAINIPKTLGGYPVVAIDEWAFDYSNITEITFPDSLAQIGENAFYNSKLETINFGKGLVAICARAFMKCTALKSVVLPDSMKILEGAAFSGCTSLESVTLNEGLSCIGNGTFYNCSSLKSIVIPNWITTLDISTFQKCSSLESVTIGASVEKVDEKAFEGCGSLKTVIAYNVGDCYISSYSGLWKKQTFYAFKGSAFEFFANSIGATVVDLETVHTHTYKNSCDPSCEVCWKDRTVKHKSDNGTVTKEATCTATGTKTYKCTLCKATIKTDTIAKVAHKYDSGKVTKKATCKVTGAKTYTCSVCKGTKTDTIAKLTTHTYSNKCDTSCNVCSATRTITHAYKTTTTKATLSKNGSIVKKCTVCGKVANNTAIKYAKTFKLSTTSYTYNGKVKTPSVTVKDSAGKTLKKNTDYTVTYASGRKNVGTYKVTIKGKGNYSFTKTLTFKINPAKTTVSKLTAGKKSITVAITKKSTQVTGYQIQYSTSKTFSKATTKTISSYKTTKYTLKSLSAKKTYYVRVRTYKTVGKTKYYSGWSTYKYVKTK